MNPENTQQNINPDEAMANLAFSTALQDQLMPQEASQEPQNAPGSEEMPQEIESTESLDISLELNDFRKEIRTLIKKEIGGIKKEIKDLLNE